MLAKGIAITAGGWEGHRGQQLHLSDGDAFSRSDMPLPDGEVPGLDDGIQFIPIIQVHVHGIGNIGMDQLHIIKEVIDENGKLFMFFFEVRY